MIYSVNQMTSYGKATISHTFTQIATVIAGEIGTEQSRECFVVKKPFASRVRHNARRNA